MSRIALQISRYKWLALPKAALLSFLLLTLACSDGGSAPEGDAIVARVVVNPAEVNVVEGNNATLVAVATDAAGRVLQGRSASWASSDASVATVSGNGVVTTLSLGTALIRATIEGKTGESRVSVTAAPVDRVDLSHSAVSLTEGESHVLGVVVKDAAGRVLQRPVAWSSNDPSVVGVDGAGRLTALRVGRADVTASVEGRSATAAITVNRAAVARIEVSPTGLVLEVGESRQMQAVVKDALGNVLQGRTVHWSLDNANATITQTGLLTAISGGYVTVIATSEGVSAAVGGTIIDAVYDFDLVYYSISRAGSSELFVLPLGTGSAPIRLNAGSVSRSPSPSPDGARIAFAVSMDSGTERVDDIFAVDRDGLNMKRLTASEGADDQPAWSPNGGRIAYHHWDVGSRSDIWLMNADGTGQRSLTGDMPAAGYRSAPAWSRDGSRIAFAQMENGPAGTTASIWIMDANGFNKRQLTSTVTGFDATPSWSHDGSRIAFMRYYAGDADIAIVDVNSGTVVRIPLPGLQSSPAWSPDGSLIAFTQNDGVITNIYTMQPNGTHVRLRTIDSAWGGGLAPAWINKP